MAASNVEIHSEFVGGNGGNVTIGPNWTDCSIRVTRNNDANRLYIWPLSTNVAVRVKDIQLELGSTATSYEPYTGGAPSPSPDYPQEIRVARGRNLLDESKITTGKGLTDSGEIGDSASSKVSDEIPVTVGEEYTLSLVAGNTGYKRVVAYSSSGAFVKLCAKVTNITAGNTYTATFTVPSGAAYVIAGCNSPDTHIQLERGSVATPYVPYGYVGMEAQSKNLVETVFTGNVNGSGVVTNDAQFGNLAIARVKAGEEYTFWKGQGATPYAFFTSYPRVGAISYDASRVVVTTTEPFTFTAPINGYVAIRHNANINPQLEKGSTATEYEPYYHSTTPILLPSRGWVAGLPDGTCDTLTLDGAGKVMWERGTGEVVLDGSESWSTSSAANVYYKSIDANGKKTGVNDEVICNRFINNRSGRASASFVSGNVHVQNGTSGGKFAYFKHGASASVADWKTWLSTHPVTVLYPLATPVTEERGYVEDWPTDLPSGCQISIPELDDLNIRYHIDSSAMEIARQWYERARSEYAEELMELRVTVNDLATRIH